MNVIFLADGGERQGNFWSQKFSEKSCQGSSVALCEENCSVSKDVQGFGPRRALQVSHSTICKIFIACHIFSQNTECHTMQSEEHCCRWESTCFHNIKGSEGHWSTLTRARFCNFCEQSWGQGCFATLQQQVNVATRYLILATATQSSIGTRHEY